MKYILFLILLTKISIAAPQLEVSTRDARGGGLCTGAPEARFDNGVLTVEFDSAVQSPKISRTVNRKDCTLSIPVHVPDGFRIKMSSFELKTKMVLPAGSEMQLRAEPFVSGGKGKVLESVTKPERPLDQEISLSGQPEFSGPCGGDQIVRVNASYKIKDGKGAVGKFEQMRFPLELTKCQ